MSDFLERRRVTVRSEYLDCSGPDPGNRVLHCHNPRGGKGVSVLVVGKSFQGCDTEIRRRIVFDRVDERPEGCLCRLGQARQQLSLSEGNRFRGVGSGSVSDLGTEAFRSRESVENLCPNCWCVVIGRRYVDEVDGVSAAVVE